MNMFAGKQLNDLGLYYTHAIHIHNSQLASSLAVLCVVLYSSVRQLRYPSIISLPIVIKFYIFSLVPVVLSLRAPPSHIPRMWKTAPKIIPRTLGIVQLESTTIDTRYARVFTDRLRKTLRPTFQLSNLGPWTVG